MAPPSRVFRLVRGRAPLRAEGAESRRSERRGDTAARRDRSATGAAVIVSVLLHALIIALWPAVTIPAPELRALDDAPPSLHIVRVRDMDAAEPDPAPVPAAARPIPAPGPPAVTLADAVRLSPGLDLAPASPITPRAPPRPPMPGVRTTSADLFVRPVAMSILTNWRPDVPAGGVETTIRVHTDAAGRATGLVELVPQTPSHRLDAEIAARVRELQFQPAVRGGQPVAAWAEITLVLCPRGVTATSPASPSGRASPCAESVRVVSGNDPDG